MRYRAYEEYKESGDEWLPELPEHWAIQRNKAMFSLVKNKVGKRSSEYQLLSLTLNGIIPRDIESGKGKMPAEFDTYQEVKPDDLVFCLFDIDETPRTIGISELDGMITGAYTVFRCLPNAIPQYVCYYYLHLDSFKGLRPFYTGLRKVVRSNTFLSIKIPAPPLEEQTQIATFLDRETAKIDTLIAKQEELIALLGEKRQAVISHAVTKGLNPHAPLKDSGIEWLGQIPKHWVICKLGYVSDTIQTGPFGSQLHAEDYVEGGIPLINPAHIVNGVLIPDNKISLDAETAIRLAQHKMTNGNIVFARRGELGRCAVIRPENDGWVCGTGSIKLALREKQLLPDFAYQFLSTEAVKIALSLESKGSTMDNLNTEILYNLKVLVPPMVEQKAISKFVTSRENRFDELIQKANQAIVLLKERRTALISAAVTGKIDVRQAMKNTRLM